MSVFEDIEFSKVDISREKIKGFPEIIYGEYKTSEQITAIMKELVKHGQNILVTRVKEEKAMFIQTIFPECVYHALAQTVTLTLEKNRKLMSGTVTILSAGTADLSVVEEARVTAEWMGCQVNVIQDVGVAGLSRLLSYVEEIREADIIISVAGMEGALPSVVSGLVDIPVIAVPTSIGYGANLEGVTTLLAMLSSCSSGISVVNVDNGFGAAYQAALFIRQIEKRLEK